jgi:DHA3 family macrolide efflux protein-like MFS transporter
MKIDAFFIFCDESFLSSLIMLLPLSVATIAGSLFLMLVVAPIVNACSQAIWQRKTPADVQGKVFAVRRMFAWFMTPMAFLLAGPLADRVFEPHGHPAAWVQHTSMGLIGTEPGGGIRYMFVLAGLSCMVISGVMFLFPRFRHVEAELPDADLKAEHVEQPSTETLINA